MEGSVIASSNPSLLDLEYWLQWQVLVCALILILTATMAANFLLRNRGIHPLKPAVCGPHAGPTSILESFSSTVAFAAMAFFLVQTVSAFGLYSPSSFPHSLATIVSGRDVGLTQEPTVGRLINISRRIR